MYLTIKKIYQFNRFEMFFHIRFLSLLNEIYRCLSHINASYKLYENQNIRDVLNISHESVIP